MNDVILCKLRVQVSSEGSWQPVYVQHLLTLTNKQI